MNILENIDFKILFFLLMFGVFCSFYKLLVSLFAIKKPVRDYKIVDDKYKFLFLIPACNEEAVIKETLEHLDELNYDKNLFDVAVLVNNSTDKTLNIVEESNFEAIEIKFGKTCPKGKPHVLKKFFEQNEFWVEYDYVCILDADNIVSKKFLKEINSQIISKKFENEDVTVIQGYLGIKNPFSSLMAAGYGGSYFIANRAYQYAKYRLGFNAAIGGTGFVIESDYIIENGWMPKTYTEDFELQIELSVKDKRVYWNHFAEIYDEKPLTLKQAIRQRNRWAQGHWRVTFTTTIKQIVSMFNVKKIHRLGSKLDCLIYSYSMLRPIILIDLFINLGIFRFGLPRYLKIEIFSMIEFYLLLSIYAYLIMPLYSVIMEGKYLYDEHKFRKIVLLYLASYYTGYTYFISQVIGFFTWFKKQNNWSKTQHNVIIKNK
ncbi:MAG: glycosyltransferase [Sarcina sp.]